MPGSFVLGMLLASTLAALASIGMQSVAFGLVPLMFLDGHVLAQAVVAFGPVVFLAARARATSADVARA